MNTAGEPAGWTFDIDEVSMGVYEVTGRDEHGRRRVQMTGTDPDALLADCRKSAEAIALQTRA
jgi:hypothetical protein